MWDLNIEGCDRICGPMCPSETVQTTIRRSPIITNMIIISMSLNYLQLRNEIKIIFQILTRVTGDQTNSCSFNNYTVMFLVHFYIF